MSENEPEQTEQGDPPAGETAPANTDVIPGPPGLWARMRSSIRQQPSSQMVRWTAAILFALVTVGSASVAFATYDYSNRYSGLIFPGAWVAGVDLGGMNEAEAMAAVDQAIEPELTRKITLRWRGEKWRVTPKQLGARNDAKALVAAAAQTSREANFFDKARMRVLGSNNWFDESVSITYPKRALRSFLRGLGSGFDRPARDATIDYSTGWVKVVPERSGRVMRPNQTYNRLNRALDEGASSVTIVADVEPPKVRAGKFEQVLLLRIGENRLYLYEDGKITHKWTVAPGQPYYPTPTGMFEIIEKRYMPTWVNPAPDGWGAGMPASIPPGISNPLGLRALNWSADGIRFHGTTATYSLGYNASHGCVRMANEDVIELYDLVDVGTPIVSTIVAPLRPLYSPAPDPAVVEPVADQDTDEPAAQDRSSDRKKDN
jgi:lipoprotein-anchoring transpeptidase ErfK/SrfK